MVDKIPASWKVLAAAADLPSAFRTHFAFLAGDAESKALLDALSRDAKSAHVVHGQLAVTFSRGAIRCGPPTRSKAGWPPSFARCRAAHSFILLEEGLLMLGNGDPPERSVLADA